tara:strand:+ start:1339 stop:2901 length:1563 start_codon:yes stop_codon:yes gene_type:complete
MKRNYNRYLLKYNLFSLEVIVPLVFVLIGLLGVFNHVLWRDEMQGWLVASKSNSIVSLWKNNAPSGHPILWSLLIYWVKNITSSPLSMQLMHWFLGSIAIIIFWIFNPMSKLHKVLFTFGYFPFWEYFFISRHYVLAELFLFIFCVIYPYRKRSYIPLSLVIGLQTNTHAFSWAIAFACFICLIADWIVNHESRRHYMSKSYWRYDLLFSFLLLISLSAFSAYSLLQVSGSVDLSPSFIDLRHFFRVFGRIFGGYLLVIPDSSRWLDLLIAFSFSLLFLSVTIFLLRRSLQALVFFVSGFLFLFLFNYFIYLGVGSRHYGYYFLIFIASLWISKLPSGKVTFTNIAFNKHLYNPLFAPKFFSFFLTFCLSVHSIAGIHRVLYDFYIPYSAGKQVSLYITENNLSNLPIFGTRDVELSTVSGYLNKNIYYPEIEGWGSFTQWQNRKSIPREDTLFYLSKFITNNQEIDKFLMILSKGSDISLANYSNTFIVEDFVIKFESSFNRSWTKPERYIIYTAERIK